MAPRNTANTSALIQALLDDLQLQSSTQMEERFALLEKRIENLEKLLVPEMQLQPSPKVCCLCDNHVLARGLCSKHYQQWRYRQRQQVQSNKSKSTKNRETIYLRQSNSADNMRADN